MNKFTQLKAHKDSFIGFRAAAPLKKKLESLAEKDKIFKKNGTPNVSRWMRQHFIDLQ